jgi:hypothetical protein
MRTISFLITAMAFSALFLSLVLMSAILTGAAHSQMAGHRQLQVSNLP